jgi:hypothetical protein
MTQTEFNYEAGQEARDAGLERASNPFFRRKALDDARSIARAWAQRNGSVTFDDVYLEMKILNKHPENLGPAAGNVFRTGEFIPCGWKQSNRESNHARAMRVWRLK